MCGICGVAWAEPGRPVERALLRTMARVVVHRGPDGEGYHSGPGVGLAVRQLSIIDLETGDQPIANEDGSVVVICNGEIYNHVELRRELMSAGHSFRTRSDVEVIVHLYEDCGPAVVDRLRGMFAFALWDSTRRRLMLARDRMGSSPSSMRSGRKVSTSDRRRSRSSPPPSSSTGTSCSRAVTESGPFGAPPNGAKGCARSWLKPCASTSGAMSPSARGSAAVSTRARSSPSWLP